MRMRVTSYIDILSRPEDDFYIDVITEDDSYSVWLGNRQSIYKRLVCKRDKDIEINVFISWVLSQEKMIENAKNAFKAKFFA